MKKYCLFLIIFSFFFSISYANDKTPDFTSEVSDSLWVDSLMSTMSIDQKIGQLFMVAAYSNKNQQHIDFIKDLIEKEISKAEVEVGGDGSKRRCFSGARQIQGSSSRSTR